MGSLVLRINLKRMMNDRKTLLGVGPMSKNCVDAVINISGKHDLYVMLVASRRQIECAAMGGGYVNNWTTEDFASYVIDCDKKGKVVLCRDHGGPWQHPGEVRERLSSRRAMESAKRSFEVDIKCGFEIVHIDTSLEINGSLTVDDAVDRACELYEHCHKFAVIHGKEIEFEIGTEEQSGLGGSLDESKLILDRICGFCDQNNLKRPLFVVLQTGTRTIEDRNIGSLQSELRVKGELAPEIQLPLLTKMCDRYGVNLKEHNGDYLSDECLEWHPRIGINAMNVAPEFGVIESRALLELMEEYGLKSEYSIFTDLVAQSDKWVKWSLPEKEYSPRWKAEIAGHYFFSSEIGREVIGRSRVILAEKGVDYDMFVRKRLEDAISRYCKHLRLI